MEWGGIVKTSGRASDCLMVYVTAATGAEARRIARALVEERLAACVNIMGPIGSLYRWKGAIAESREVAFWAKTTRARFAALRARVCALHSYDVPCVVALPIAAGHRPFLAWIAGSVRTPAPLKGRGQSAAPAPRGSARRGG